MRLSLSSAALADLRAIYREGVTRFGERQSLKYQEGMSDAFAFLCEFPFANRERPELGADGYRVHRFQAHVILYRLAGSDLFVVRVRHGREDWLEGGG